MATQKLYAGAKLLMDRLGLEAVDRIQLTGAFGSHIDTKYAITDRTQNTFEMIFLFR